MAQSDIIIALTPFHLLQIKRISQQYGWDMKRSVVFAMPVVSREKWVEHFGEEVEWYVIPGEGASLPRLIKDPLKEVPKHQGLVKALDKKIRESDVLRTEVKRLIIGSDKDIFTQLLFEHLKPEVRVIAIDEGTGFYKETSDSDKAKMLAYRTFSKALFGHRFRYIGTLGLHPRIDELYVRFPEHLPYPHPTAAVHEIAPATRGWQKENTDRGILILSSPLSEDHHCDKETEMDVLDSVVGISQAYFGEVFLKPHPREQVEKYTSLGKSKLILLDHSVSAEELDYHRYKCIMHFGSSVVLDIHQSGYPLERVVTLDMAYSKNPLTMALFKKGGYCLLFSDQLEHFLHTSFEWNDDAG